MNVTGEEQRVEIIQEVSTVEKGDDFSLGAASDSEGSSTFTVTKGLPWRAVISDGSWLNWAATNPATSGDAATGEIQNLVVKTTAVNPYARELVTGIRVEAGASVGSVDYDVLKKEISVRQAASTVQGSEVEVNPEAASSLSSTFTATPGLAWIANVTSGDWITLSGATSGNPTTGTTQDISFNVAVNPTDSPRDGVISVRAGDTSDGPVGTIAVKQNASVLSVSVDPADALATTAGISGTYTMNGTNGLSYSFTVGFPSWLTVTDGSASANGGVTSGSNQTLTYKTTSVNPNGAERKATVTVKAGSMTKDVEIKQSASAFSTANGAATIPAAGGNTTGSVTATTGLLWTISPTIHNGITVSPSEGSGNQQLTFTGSANTGSARTGSFTVTVTGANPARTATVTATQAAGDPGAYVGNLQVCMTEEVYSNWSTANTNCSKSTKEGKSGWRLPSKDELVTMYNNKAALQSVSGFIAFVNGYYWSSTVQSSGKHWSVNISNGNTYSGADTEGTSVRCVRNK